MKMNEWMNECMNEWVSELMNKWMNEWMNEWENEWICERGKHYIDAYSLLLKRKKSFLIYKKDKLL